MPSARILAIRPISAGGRPGIILLTLRIGPGSLKEVPTTLLNPLAIGVTLGGWMLDIVVPRPKPRYGYPREHALHRPRAAARITFVEASLQELRDPPIALRDEHWL